MATRTVISRIQTKRDTAVNWESNNPVLLNGEEIIVDTNAGEIRKKIGDGTKTYTQLPFTDETLRNLISNKVDKVSGKGLSTNDFTNTLLTKLNGIEEGANKYTHPSSHAASMITQDSTHRFVTDTEKSTWNAKASTAVATTSTNGLMSKADKSKLDGIATGANNYTHPSSHAATMITEDTTHRFVTDAEKSTWNGKASTAVATTSANGLMSSDDKTKLDGIAVGANNYTHPSSHAATMITQDATHRFVTDTEKSTWNAKASTAVATTSANGLMSKADKSKLDGIAANANNYSHPTYTSKTSGLYKITVDGTGHVSATTAVAKADITGLGIPAQDTTYSAATTSAPGLMSAADKKKLDGIATGATKVTVDSALSSTSTNPVQNKIINSSLDALTSRVSTLETNYNTLLAKVKTAVFWE